MNQDRIEFLQIMGEVAYSSYFEFEMSDHNPVDVIKGDYIWSNGHCIQIADWIGLEELTELLDKVSNRKAFKGALRRVGFKVD